MYQRWEFNETRSLTASYKIWWQVYKSGNLVGHVQFLNSWTSCLLVPWRMVQAMYKYCRRNWNYIYRLLSAKYVRMMVLWHPSKEVRNSLKRNIIATLNWPGKSWNVNPFENLWETVTINVAEYQSSVSVSNVVYCRFDIIKTLPLKLEPTTLLPS